MQAQGWLGHEGSSLTGPFLVSLSFTLTLLVQVIGKKLVFGMRSLRL